MKNKTEAAPGKFKSAILNWLGFRFTDVEQWRSLLRGGTNVAGVAVNQESILKLSAAYACGRLISQTIASCPCSVYRAGEKNSVPVPDHPLNALLAVQPNIDQTPFVFWESLVTSILFEGNGWIEKQMLGDRLVSLAYRNPNQMSWIWDSTLGRYVYQFVTINGTRRTIPERDLIHIPNYTIDGKFGMSTIGYGAEVMGSAIAANNAANATFKNGLMPTVAFQMEKVLTKAQREEFRDNLDSIAGALKAGKSPLLEGGMKAQQVGINPNDSQLLESRAFSIEEVCRWFGVPPSMIGHNDKASSWASSLTNLNQWYRRYTVGPLAVKIQQALNIALFSPLERGKLFVKFDLDELERGDLLSRSTFWASGLQNGYLNRNEVRKAQNMAPIEGGDAYTVQSSMIDLNQVISQAIAAAVSSTMQPQTPQKEIP